MNRTLKKEGHGTTRDNVVWTSEMDNVLIDGLLEEQRKGNRHDGMFRSELYHNTVKTLQSSFGPFIQKSNLKNRTKTLKKYFAAFSNTFHGWSYCTWNANMKMFDALDKAWEKLLIQEYNNCVYFGRDPKQEGGGDSLFKVTTNFMYFMHRIA